MKISLKKNNFSKQNIKSFDNKAEKTLIQELILKFQTEKSLANIIKQMSQNKELIYIYPNLFIYKNYKIYVGPDLALKDSAKAYKIISKYNNNIYPEFIDSILNNNQYYRILVIKNNSNDKQSSRKYSEAKENIAIADKKKFYELHEKIANDTNLHNPLLIKNIDNWYVDQSGIHVPFCDELINFENTECKNKYLKDLRSKLGLIY